jgi:hypothetical protein
MIIVYDIATTFQIIPHLNHETSMHFKDFICQIKNVQNNFFWTFDDHRSQLVIDNSTTQSEIDIVDQFLTLVFWLFEREYHLSGSFCYRIEKMVGQLTIESTEKVVNHRISYDCSDSTNSFTEYRTSRREPMQPTNNSMYYSPLNTCVQQKFMDQQKFIDLERKNKKLLKLNYSIWNWCTILGLFSVGSLLLYIHIKLDK